MRVIIYEQLISLRNRFESCKCKWLSKSAKISLKLLGGNFTYLRMIYLTFFDKLICSRCFPLPLKHTGLILVSNTHPSVSNVSSPTNLLLPDIIEDACYNSMLYEKNSHIHPALHQDFFPCTMQHADVCAQTRNIYLTCRSQAGRLSACVSHYRARGRYEYAVAFKCQP